MKKGRSPGPDGAPIEFFVILWETTGKLITEVISEGASRGWFPGWFNKGDVVLLPKGGDTRQLSNKRPITLLNTVYKIYTKALQRRVVPVLESVIRWNQSASVPGRNILTSVLTCNEAVHEAKKSGKDYILLQLDFKKAFDSVCWRFIMEALEPFGFGVQFLKYIKAILGTASSSIIVNGIRSKPVKVSRSVRQGCPLSPLLFILVTQTLTAAMEFEVHKGEIQGIYLQRANMHYSLGFYADDSHVIIRAEREGALKTKALLDMYANATGLMIQWEKLTARWIGPRENNLPQWIEDLTWSWKARGETTKLLGFHFGEGVAAAEMLRKCDKKIQSICNSPMYSNLSICGRVTVANTSLLGTKQGGLGLLSLTKQYVAFAARTIRWAYQTGDHPLQKIIRAHIEEESSAAFGVPGVQWLVTPAKCRTEGKSAILNNIFRSWEVLKLKLLNRKLHTKEDWQQIPLWGTAQEAVDGQIRKVDSRARRVLWEEGYKKLGDLTDESGQNMADWEQRRYRGSEQKQVEFAYSKLLRQITHI
ncbi:hypothetical protein R1sor_006362 [Riccia sorocarpa]|uniref:Reverse transcriptase domain-containing protein n=1 Tax=Riccia sorocarpa TaxID=122646 RepID=A0ABD3HRG4_9MARC